MVKELVKTEGRHTMLTKYHLELMDQFCYLCFMFGRLSCLFIVALWSPAGKGWPLGSLVCYVLLCFCHFPTWCPWSGVVLGCMDS